jgi:hypothetical protein
MNEVNHFFFGFKVFGIWKGTFKAFNYLIRKVSWFG